MSPDQQQHRCTVQTRGDGRPYLAFQPSNGHASTHSSSLFTLDLRSHVSLEEARILAAEINRQLWGVSSTVF